MKIIAKLSEEERARIVGLYRAGQSSIEVSQLCGVQPATVLKLARMYGVEVRGTQSNGYRTLRMRNVRKGGKVAPPAPDA